MYNDLQRCINVYYGALQVGAPRRFQLTSVRLHFTFSFINLFNFNLFNFINLLNPIVT